MQVCYRLKRSYFIIGKTFLLLLFIFSRHFKKYSFEQNRLHVLKYFFYNIFLCTYLHHNFVVQFYKNDSFLLDQIIQLIGHWTLDRGILRHFIFYETAYFYLRPHHFFTHHSIFMPYKYYNSKKYMHNRDQTSLQIIRKQVTNNNPRDDSLF